jgi:hypothetical protein
MGFIGLLLAGLACSRAGNTEDAAASPAREAAYRGKVVVTGSEPGTSVQLIGSDRNLELVGSLEPELRRLAGAGLVARGALEGKRPLQRLEVRDYEITDIDGEVPSTGILRLRDGEAWLAGEDTVKLVGVPERLQSSDGAKVWIVGPRSGMELQVQSFGIINQPAPGPARNPR